MDEEKKQAIINALREDVRERFFGEGSGHDWYHIDRVYNMALNLCREEKADWFIVSLGALLHDIADHKFHPDDLQKGERDANAIMTSYGIDEQTRKKVVDIVKEISYKGAGVATPMSTLEGMLVQDADRLDAIGAVGIARAFAYGGSRNRPLYDPEMKPEMHQDFDSYRKSESHTINHFYEKLLLLRDRMNTQAAKKIADERHLYMENWLARFFGECEGRL